MASNSWGIDKLIEKNSQIYKPIVSNTSFSLPRNNKLKHTARERERRGFSAESHSQQIELLRSTNLQFFPMNHCKSAFLMSSHFRFQAGNLVRWRRCFKDSTRVERENTQAKGKRETYSRKMIIYSLPRERLNRSGELLFIKPKCLGSIEAAAPSVSSLD